MTTVFGNYSLCAAVLVAGFSLLFSIAAARLDSSGMRRASRWGVYALAALLTISSIALFKALYDADFRLSYVARYTERALPMGYKLAAFWAGQEGSLLLWAWLLAVMSTIFVFQHRKAEAAEQDIALGTLAAVIGFFAALMLFAANPFNLNAEPLADGHGLNPMLQDPGMIAHPPALFIGYAGYTIPFALLLGALFTGRLQGDWAVRSRVWALISWLFLGIGIVLGAQWAYVELGWGGYWAWDPVENASLLPWLTGTAMLHSIVGLRQRGLFKRWNAVLAAGTFILCIFGTYITRSGVVQSVHTFTESPVGTFFQVFLFLTILLSLVMVLLRWGAMRPERPMESLISREGAFLAANLLFVTMMLLTLVGTMFPVISKVLNDQSVELKQTFYNRMVLPPALFAVILMGLAPLLPYGKIRQTAREVVWLFALPAVLAAGTIVVLMVMGVYRVWALASGVAGGVVAGCILVDLVRRIWNRRESTRENLLVAAVRMVLASHRRYGAQLTHVGMMMIVVGVAGSSLYNTQKLLKLPKGGSEQVGRYTLRLDWIGEVRGENYAAVEVRVLMTDASGKRYKLYPQRRFYDKSEQPNTEVALRTNWREDLYVTFAGAEPDLSVVALMVMVSPLVWWIWAGGVVMTLGGVVCLVPRLVRRSAVIEDAQLLPVAKPIAGFPVATGTAR